MLKPIKFILILMSAVSLLANIAVAESNYQNFAIIVPVKQATLASQLAGKIQAIHVKEGDSFNEGTPLVTFDCGLMALDLEKAKTEAAATRHEVEQLQNKRNADDTLSKASLHHQKAEITIKRLQAQLKQCVINAPFPGKVSSIFVYAHEDVKASTPLIEIIHQDLEIKLYVSSTWLSWLREGASFTIHVEELDQTFPATVTKIHPHVDTASQTIDIYGRLVNSTPNLVSGMSGMARFQGPE